MVSGALLIIPVLVLVSVGVMLAVFLDVAFSQRSRRRAIQPLPLLVGDDLHDWAVKEGQGLTQKSLAGTGKVDAVVLAQTATAFADDVLARTLHLSTPHGAGLNCRDGNGEVPRVTMPEALSIVEELRQRGAVELIAVRQRARRNLAAPPVAAAGAETALAHCPLRTIAGTCACALSRPLACSGRCLAGCDQPAGDAGWGRTLGEGLLKGMQAELRSAGLDGDRYELNEVLARLPDVPDAAARWQRGEHLLAAAGTN